MCAFLKDQMTLKTGIINFSFAITGINYFFWVFWIIYIIIKETWYIYLLNICMLPWFYNFSQQIRKSWYRIDPEHFKFQQIYNRGGADVFSSLLSLPWCSSKGQTHQPEVLISHSRHKPSHQGSGSQIEKRQCHFSPWQKTHYILLASPKGQLPGDATVTRASNQSQTSGFTHKGRVQTWNWWDH